MTINHKKVLVIVNGDVQVSRDCADWYATARGLRSTTLNGVSNEYHRLVVNFGTTVMSEYSGPYLVGNFIGMRSGTQVSPFSGSSSSFQSSNHANLWTVQSSPASTFDYSALGFLDAVGQYCIDQSIECVLMSTCTPTTVSKSGQLGIALPALVAYAKRMRQLGGPTEANFNTADNELRAWNEIPGESLAPASAMQCTPAPHYARRKNVAFDYGGGGDSAKSRISQMLPFGRLGLPDYQAKVINGSTVDTLARLQTITNNAITAEGTDNHLKNICVALTDYGYYADSFSEGGEAYQMRAAYYNFLIHGVSNIKTYRCTLSGYLTRGYQLSQPFAAGGESFPNYSTYLAGGYNSPRTDLFGMLQSQPANQWTGIQGGNPAPAAYGTHPMWNNYNVLPGAWAMHWCSYSFSAADILYLGGSAAIVTDGEPYDIANLFAASEFAYWTPLGYSFAELVYMSNIGTMLYRQFPIGDPLYRPYKTGWQNQTRFQ